MSSQHSTKERFVSISTLALSSAEDALQSYVSVVNHVVDHINMVHR